MNDAITAPQARWRMLFPILTLVAGGLIVSAMAYLYTAQSNAFDISVAKVRDFRVARLELTSGVLRLGWTAASIPESGGAEDSAGIYKALARVEDTLARFTADPDGMTTTVDTALAEFRRLVPRDAIAARQIDGASLKRSFMALDGAMNRLDSYNAGEVRALMQNQRFQFNVAVGVALLLLTTVGMVVLRNHHRLNVAESNLRESESNLRQMVELMPQMVWSSDSRGMCDYLSSRWTTFTGSPTVVHLGLGWLDLLHNDDRQRMAEHWKTVVASGSSLQIEYRLRRHDGVYRWFDVRAGRVFDALGQPLKWFGSCTDITERKLFEADLTQHRDQLEAQVEQRTAALVSALDERSKAQQRLQELNVQFKEAEVFMRLVADNIPGRIAYWDRDKKCRFVNRAYCNWFGQPSSELIGRGMVELRGAEYVASLMPRIAAALAGEEQDYEREEFSATGEHAISRVQYLPDARDGEIHGFFLLVTNITRHKQSEQLLQLSNAQLAEARDRADSANRAKSNFLANMSHEIRTPMNAILGLTHMLRRDIEDPTHQARLTKISNVAHHLLQVINDILDLSKIEAGKLALENIDFSLDALLTRTCTMVLDVAREKGLEVVLDTNQLPDRLNGDPTRLMQALLNLLSNAVKFTERGSVILRGELVSQDESGLLIRFEIRDTGIGIAQEDMASLFTPFAQVDGSSTRRHGGTGLGLTITRHIAELMGGGAGGESTPGQGSRFWINVRLSRALQDEAKGVPVLNGLRGLLVDDLPDARAAMAQILRMKGLRMDVAASGDEALQLVATATAADDPYGVVVMDFLMPGMDGFETARRMRDVLHRLPPMVLISAHEREGLQQQAIDAGFSAVMLKPVTPSMVLDCLMRLLKNAGQVAPALRGMESIEEVLRENYRGTHILLAEDNPINQEVAAELLQAAGLTVDIAGDGEQAVRMARRGTYDLVLMDVQMPRLDGLQSTQLLRQEPKFASLPIIAMTANAFLEDRQACLDAGMNDHLAKPVDPRVLYETLLRWLPVRKPAPVPVAVVPEPIAPLSAAQLLEGISGLDLEVTYLQCAGKPELALRVLRQFLAHYRNAGAALLDHLQVGELEEPRRKLHSLRGAAGAVGAVQIQETVKKLEAAIKQDLPMEQLLVTGRQLRDELDGLIAELALRLET